MNVIFICHFLRFMNISHFFVIPLISFRKSRAMLHIFWLLNFGTEMATLSYGLRCRSVDGTLLN